MTSMRASCVEEWGWRTRRQAAACRRSESVPTRSRRSESAPTRSASSSVVTPTTPPPPSCDVFCAVANATRYCQNDYYMTVATLSFTVGMKQFQKPTEPSIVHRKTTSRPLSYCRWATWRAQIYTKRQGPPGHFILFWWASLRLEILVVGGVVGARRAVLDLWLAD